MPEIYPVTAVGIQGILQDLGIQVTPKFPMFYMSDTILPVSIVNAQVDLTAKQVLGPQVFTSEGLKTAPAASTVLADTGALVAGAHSFSVWFSILALTTSNSILLQHRDAANAANIWSFSFQHDKGVLSQSFNLPSFALTLATNERVRVILSAQVAAGGELYQAAILSRPEF